MKFQKKPEVVDADVYQPGMEDAFGYRPRELGGHTFGMLFDGLGRPVKPDKSYGALVPLLLTKGRTEMDGYVEILPGDYIVTDVEGNRTRCSPEVFPLLYAAIQATTPRVDPALTAQQRVGEEK